MSDASIYLLRDHVTLLQDLMADWNARPAANFDHFVPCDYRFKWLMQDVKIFLCVNEGNIISQPNELDDNGMTGWLAG